MKPRIFLAILVFMSLGCTGVRGLGSSESCVRVLIETPRLERLHRKGVNTFEVNLEELLHESGVFFRTCHSLSSAIAGDPTKTILIVASAEPNDVPILLRFVAQGGHVIVASQLDGLSESLGCKVMPPVATGYAVLPNQVPLRFLHAMPWEASSSGFLESFQGELHEGSPSTPTSGAMVHRFRVGRGVLERWAVDVPSTLVELRQGAGPITRDGLPAPDGSANLDDGILKADDGMALDWTLDRIQTETGQPYFPHPYVDLWREEFTRELLRFALQADIPIPFLDSWPEGEQKILLISHDSDRNLDASALTTLAILKDQHILDTWCIIEPGFTPPVLNQILADGHEVGFHFDALVSDGYGWNEGFFLNQLAWLQGVLGLHPITSNKDHYTTQCGWGDLFRWCEHAGITADQTRGPSKRGNVGFLFGTAHPYFPMAEADEDNRIYDVVEIGFLTQDLDLPAWADASLIVPFLEGAAQVHGVAHFLFHPYHIHTRPAVRAAFLKMIAEAKARNFRIWTSRQIDHWYRARRHFDLLGWDGHGGVRLWSPSDWVPGISPPVVWVPWEGGPQAGVLEQRFGVWCLKVPVSWEPTDNHSLKDSPTWVTNLAISASR